MNSIRTELEGANGVESESARTPLVAVDAPQDTKAITRLERSDGRQRRKYVERGHEPSISPADVSPPAAVGRHARARTRAAVRWFGVGAGVCIVLKYA